MKDLETLQELVANVTYGESLQSCKSFTSSILELAISQEAPQFYNKDELIQLKDLSKLVFSVESKSENTKKVTQERLIEEMSKKKRFVPIIKKSRMTILTKTINLPVKLLNLVIELNGQDLKFLMHKKLFFSDVNPNNNRLSMPTNEIKCDFLTQGEIAKLNEREGPNKRLVGIEVIVLDPCFRKFTMTLKKWIMKTSTYNLTTNWNTIVFTNKLKKDQEFQIWSFRVDSKLYFLLNKL